MFLRRRDAAGVLPRGHVARGQGSWVLQGSLLGIVLRAPQESGRFGEQESRVLLKSSQISIRDFTG